MENAVMAHRRVLAVVALVLADPAAAARASEKEDVL
jgi:hypothetical protein